MIKSLIGWKGYAAAAGIAALLAGGAVLKVQDWRYEAKIASLERSHAVLLEQQALAVVESVHAARNLEQRRTSLVEKERDHAIEQSQALAADVAAGRAASERLRNEYNALRTRHASGNPSITVGGQGEQSADPIGLLIGVLEGMDETGREISEYADRLRIAGLMCEQTHDGL